MIRSDPQYIQFMDREQDPRNDTDFEDSWEDAVARALEPEPEELQNPLLPFEAAGVDAKLDAETKRRRVLERRLSLERRKNQFRSFWRQSGQRRKVD